MIRLPANWTPTTLGAFSDLINGRAFKPSDWSTNGLPIVRIQNLRNQEATFNRYAGAIDDRHRISTGDLLFAWSGTPGTSFRAHIWSRGDAVLNQHIFKVVVDPSLANAEYLKVAINAHLPTLIKQAKGGAGLKHLTRTTVEQIPIALPPRPEQDRIMEALAATAGRLAATETAAAELALRLPLVEKQILTRVISGVLLYSDDMQTSSLSIGKNNISQPRIDAVGDIQIGRQRTPDVHVGPSMRPYLRVANVLDDRIDATDVMAMNFDDEEFERYRLHPSDILLNEGQSLELVGRAAMYRGNPEDVGFTNTLIRFQAGPLVDPEYALLVFRAYQQTGRFQEIAKITTNLAHLGARRFAALEFPLRPLKAQQHIARIARHLIEKVRAVGEALTLLQDDANALIKSFEAAALAGRLTDQSDLERAPEIEPPSQTARTKIRSTASSNLSLPTDGRATDNMPPSSLVEALVHSGRPLDGQALFIAAGYPKDSSVLQIEQFFLELRNALKEERILRSEGEDDVFLLASADR